MQATPSMDMREKRAPTIRQSDAVPIRASAEIKAGMPPIQMAAPSWCRKLTPSRMARSPSRAAAWVVSVAATSTTAAAASNSGAWARGPARNSATTSTRAAAIFTRPASAKLAPMALCTGRSMVPTRTETSSAMVAASQATRRTALQAAMRAASRRIAGPAAASAPCCGRARKIRKKTDPKAIDWARMVRPWMMMLR